MVSQSLNMGLVGIVFVFTDNFLYLDKVTNGEVFNDKREISSIFNRL